MGDPVVVESWHIPRALSDEALRLLTSLPMDEIERRLRVPMAADGEVVELPPRPPLMEPPAHPALERYGITWDGSPDKPLLTRMADGYWTPWHVAADLLAQSETASAVEAAIAAGQPVTLPSGTVIADPAWFASLIPIRAADPLERQPLRPIPVSERLPGPGDCLPWPDEPDEAPWCWAFVKGPLGDDSWERRPVSCLTTYKPMHTHWLPAHALPLPPLPEVE